MKRLSIKTLFLLMVYLTYLVIESNSESLDDYSTARRQLFRSDNSTKTGWQVKLNVKEKAVNAHLMQLKEKAIQQGMEGDIYPPQLHFFHAKKYIEESEIFKIIKTLPKGAALHMHDTSMGDMEWVVQQTYLPNCYMCISETTQQIQFLFSLKPPVSQDCKWELVSNVRKGYKDPKVFDQLIYGNLTLIVDDPVSAYPTIHDVWSKFLALFQISGGLLTYKKLFEGYYTHALQDYYDDNVQYVEVRGLLPELYDLNQVLYNKDYVMQLYYNATKQFKKSHPDFSGAKYIYSSVRQGSTQDIREAVKESIYYSIKYPDFFAGYDLVGYEETGRTLYDYIDDLLLPSQTGYKLNYFFHAGETDWSGLPVDDNLIDAILLNTTRIGHGYAINKHPQVKQLIREKDVAIEICPISNQVLKLVDDLRNHPGASLMTEGFPVVISSDDPALWGARGLSYDWYEAFMGLGSGWADLRTLKQLAMDSLKYSAMSLTERTDAFKLWQKKWDVFIENYIHKYKL